ncbi:T9SS type A sorting domain-containing protein [Aquimarina algiphila]|uniref:T9SS type A sorting domain-containing protein n=1 Tax=Aquimarina algiphila TaxID=2047982 RepID=UPI0024927588|nr:T9SS type A sorting domain-containing protein [Aquimarina algiphila]
MKKTLFCLRRSVWAVSIVGTIISINAQQVPGLKTQANQTKISGKQIYHQAKIYDSKGNPKKPKETRIMEDVEARANYDYQRLKNPYSNEIPSGIRDAELKFTNKIAVGNDSKQAIANKAKSSKAGRFSYWQNRGPYNVGGRTRALAIDRTNENIILAGGVSGGLWRSTNGGESWRKVTNRRQSPSITCIIQDPRPGQHNTWYYGSGERFGNSAGTGGGFFRGTGIFKSTNGGRTWRLLDATNDNDVVSIGAFDIINSIDINPVNGDVYVGTWNGVYRSQNGGNSFEEVLVGGRDNTTEVEITPGGRIYATIDSGGDPNNGYFTTIDGNTWTEITPDLLPADYGRTVMEIDPSDENIVYFFTQNLSEGGPAFLLKYDATAAPEEAYTDLSANLPTTIGGPVGNLNLQGGYNMVVKVSPADPNLMFVGGTNIYRSTTGFTTPAGQESWIAGYSPRNNVDTYPDQHPDQHALIFYPSNPNKVLTGSDGGVAVTEDITTTTSQFEPVDWISLNQGYLTTQPYHVSFDPDANSDDLLAGFQDNSTWYTNSTDPTASWVDLFGGDGSYSAIADAGRTRYVSSQRGRVHRLNYDEAGELVSFSRVQPSGASGFGFIAPFILDPNNDNIMYMPAGNRIWRNNNLDEIPSISSIGNSVFAGAPTNVNWVNLPNSDTPAGSSITALDVSKYPVANRLYYGTNQGGIYKMNNANIDGQDAIDISTGKGFPEGGYVNDINIDPSDADRVIVTFSNYGIPSLFLTTDGGDTWTNISGNLEENPDGTGNGPSVRSTAFFGGSQGFFGARLQKVYVATSTGLYYTNRLNGERTRWIKESFAIGNSVTDEVRTRKDGFIAVASHGSGLYSARFPVFNELPESTLSVAYLLDDVTADINNIENFEVNVEDLFVNSNGSSINIELQNTNPDKVTATLEGDTISIEFGEGLELGDQATIVLVATSGEEQVAEGFTITISEFPVYEQVEGAVTSVPSQFFVDFGGLAQSADDFVIPEGNTWTIERIVAFGGVNNSPQLVNATVVIYEDNAGVPGEEVYNSGQIVPISDPTDTNLNLVLTEELVLEGGSYWMSVYANLAFNPGATQWFWSSQNGTIGSVTHFRDDLNLFGTGAVDWTSAEVALGRNPIDQVFEIYGLVDDGVGEPAASVDPLAVLDSDNTASPNPSNGLFSFNFKDTASKSGGNISRSIEIYDAMGNMLYSDTNVGDNTTWDASNARSGLYFARVTNGNTKTTHKLIKN